MVRLWSRKVTDSIEDRILSSWGGLRRLGWTGDIWATSQGANRNEVGKVRDVFQAGRGGNRRWRERKDTAKIGRFCRGPSCRAQIFFPNHRQTAELWKHVSQGLVGILRWREKTSSYRRPHTGSWQGSSGRTTRTQATAVEEIGKEWIDLIQVAHKPIMHSNQSNGGI